MNHNLVKEKEDQDLKEFIQIYNLETAKAYWNYNPKKSYQIWKKAETLEEYIRRKTLERLEANKTKLKH